MAEGLTSEPLLPELLTVAELAHYLGVPVSTIHFWRGKRQGPPAVKVGKRLYFRVADVAKWLEEQQATGA
jgi:excisionase family DNA binding protein